MGDQGKHRYAIIVLALLLLGGTYFLPLPLPREAQATIAITVFAMVLWIFEVLPLYITALAVAVLLILLGGFPAEKVFAQFFDRVVVLVLGGFVIAVAMHKHKLDEYLAYKLLGKFNVSSKMLLLGMIFVTAFLSMWMSNSAAAAIAMPIALIVLAKNKMRPLKSNFGKSMVLAVAYGATIGGIGTLIGSTPNVMTQKFLTENGLQFGFLDWLIRGFPFMVVMIIICWILLFLFFIPEKKKVKMIKHPHPFTASQKKVAAILAGTIILWMTENVHGIHNSVVALIPVVLLYVLNLLDAQDFGKIDWGSLVLIGGGIALGMAIDVSGLDDVFSSGLHSALLGNSYFVILLALAGTGILMTSFLSNTAASAVLVPVITVLAATLGLNETNVVVVAAMGVSLDFIFPMGTPPSALAYATRYITIKDMMKAGLLLSILGAFVLAGIAYFTWI